MSDDASREPPARVWKCESCDFTLEETGGTGLKVLLEGRADCTGRLFPLSPAAVGMKDAAGRA
jgi:hypothetical protein